jgi:hypothetical protein
MPTYRVTAPDGRKLRITGPEPPTDAELDDIFKQSAPEPTFSNVQVSPEALGISRQNIFGEVPETLSGQQPENFATFPGEIGRESVSPFVPIPKSTPGDMGSKLGMALSPITGKPPF